MKRMQRVVFLLGGFIGIFAVCQFWACGSGGDLYETNLLENSSFEEVKDRIPKGWTLQVFHGLEGVKEVEYGPDENTSYSGERSFYFKGERDTGRWYVLMQEIKVKDVKNIRLKGYMRLEDIFRTKEQFAQCNFFVSFFDKDHKRFQEMRFADKRTKLRLDTMDWFEERQTFRVPQNTEYIAVSCVLGMSGTVWFDDVTLEIPRPIPWEVSQSKNFDFHWLPERPFPSGAKEQQQAIHDAYCKKLGITSDERISYFLYPDSATIQEILGLKGDFYVSWNDREIHSIKPVNGYEVIHLIMDPFGTPPKSICEGTAFYLQGGFLGRPIHPTAIALLAQKKLPSLTSLIDYNKFARLPVDISVPAVTSFVAFLMETWDPEKLIQLYRAAKGTNAYTTFGPSFERVYGIPISEAEFRWRQFLARTAVSMSDSTRTSQPAVDGE
jgi:hypothetical protein